MKKDLMSISQLFNESVYRIPDYQRGYAWRKEQFSDFWDDLINLQPERYHYTGMLSLKELPESIYKEWEEERWLFEAKDYSAYHVVDGQQRLTTCIILINSIINIAQKNNQEYLNEMSIKDIKRKYIVEYNKTKILKAFLFGYETDNPSFEYLRYNILDEKAPGTIKETFYTLNLEMAKKFFDEKLEDLYKGQGFDAINVLFSKLVNRFKFNIHYIDDDFDVFVAFETMNNRGKKLSNLEILKNRLIYLTTIYPRSVLTADEQKKLRKNINEAWAEVYEKLGKNKYNPLNDDEYLKSHWTLMFKYSRNTGDDYIIDLLNNVFTVRAVIDGIKNSGLEELETDEDYEVVENNLTFIDDEKLTPKEINAYVSSLKDMAKYWYYSYNPKDYKNVLTEDEVNWINKLNRIGINYFRTLVVASLMNENVTSEKRLELYKTIEKFIWLCFRMAKYQASYFSARIYSCAKELLSGKISIDEVINIIKEKFESNISVATNTFYNKMITEFKDRDGFYSWNDVRYFLFEYELSMAEKLGIFKVENWSYYTKNEKDKVSIEHIYPQTANRWYWRNQFRNYNEEECKRLTGSLGNLLLLSQQVNSALQNDEFEIKKNPNGRRERGYSNGSHSEIEVSKYEDWNPNTILDRGMKLLSFMESRWNIKFEEDLKIKILGLEFMSNDRENIPEIERPVIVDRDLINSSEDGSMSVNEYIKSKNPIMVELYNILFDKMKNKIPDLFEVATNPYIAFKTDFGRNIAEVRIQSKQLKITIYKPKEEKYQIGEYLNESYTWVHNYCVYVRKIGDIETVVNAIMDSYNQII